MALIPPWARAAAAWAKRAPPDGKMGISGRLRSPRGRTPSPTMGMMMTLDTRPMVEIRWKWKATMGEVTTMAEKEAMSDKAIPRLILPPRWGVKRVRGFWGKRRR